MTCGVSKSENAGILQKGMGQPAVEAVDASPNEVDPQVQKTRTDIGKTRHSQRDGSPSRPGNRESVEEALPTDSLREETEKTNKEEESWHEDKPSGVQGGGEDTKKKEGEEEGKTNNSIAVSALGQGGHEESASFPSLCVLKKRESEERDLEDAGAKEKEKKEAFVSWVARVVIRKQRRGKWIQEEKTADAERSKNLLVISAREQGRETRRPLGESRLTL